MELHLFLGYRTGPDIFRIVCTTSSFAFVAGSLSLSLSLSLASQHLFCLSYGYTTKKTLWEVLPGVFLVPWNKFSILPCSPKLKYWLSIFLVPPAQWLSCQSICLTGRLWVRSPTKDTKTCRLHCTPVSISNAGYNGLAPICIPEYLSSTKYTKTSVSCTVGYPEYQPGTQGIVAC